MPSEEERAGSPTGDDGDFILAQELLQEGGISLGPPRQDWPEEEDPQDRFAVTIGGAVDDPAASWEFLLDAFERHRRDLEAEHHESSPTAEAASASSPDGPPGAVARTLATLLNGTLCEYSVDAGAPDTEDPPAVSSTAQPAAASTAPELEGTQLLRQSMRLALQETLEVGQLPGRRRSVRESTAEFLANTLGQRELSGDAREEVEVHVESPGSPGSPAFGVAALSTMDLSQTLHATRSVAGESAIFGERTFSEEGPELEGGHGFAIGVAGVLNLLGESLTPEDGQDGGLVALLRRLGSGPSLDLDGTARHARQLSSVLSGQRLADEEIQCLPKARFDNAEEQTCAICLVPYQQGELLTRLHCDHFFHVGCLAEWLRFATRCPLCRAECVT